MNIVEIICQEIDSFRGVITKDELIQIIDFCDDMIRDILVDEIDDVYVDDLMVVK